MGKKIIILLLMVVMLLPGCKKAEGAIAEEKDQSVSYTSEVSEEECRICGSNNRSLMDYYRKSGMIGLVCLNTMDISSLDTRMYSNDGTTVIDEGSGTLTTSHGTNECSFKISGMPNRGIMQAEVSYGENASVDFTKVKTFLCQKCLDKVAEMYEDEMQWGDGTGRFPEVCLVDFATNELYPLGKHSLGYFVRDFWVHIDHTEDMSSIMVIYASEDKMKGYSYVTDDSQ